MKRVTAVLWAGLFLFASPGAADDNSGASSNSASNSIGATQIDVSGECPGASYINLKQPDPPPPTPLAWLECIHGGGWELGDANNCDPFDTTGMGVGFFENQYLMYGDPGNAAANGTDPNIVSPWTTLSDEVNGNKCMLGLVQSLSLVYPQSFSPRMVALGASAGAHLALTQALNRLDWADMFYGWTVGAIGFSSPTNLVRADNYGMFLPPGNAPADQRRRFSPALNVGPNTAPIYLAAGLNDSLVNPQDSRDMFAAMPKDLCRRYNCVLSLYPGSDHGLQGPAFTNPAATALEEAWFYSAAWAVNLLYYDTSFPATPGG